MLILEYKNPLDFELILSFFQPRALEGVEVITKESYSRTFRIGEASGFFRVTHCPSQSTLQLRIDGVPGGSHMEISNRVRRMFDLDTDFSSINRKFSKEPFLKKGMRDGQVPRLPGVFDPFEFVVRAILGQQITVKAATTLAARLVKKAALNTGRDFPTGLDYFFPNPSELLEMDLSGIGITGIRQETLRTVARAIKEKEVTLTPDQSFDNFYEDFSKLKGIGDWTVNYVAMRGLGMKDCFPAGDLGVIKALTKDEGKPSKKEILNLAETWRPYRTYATLCLWKLYK